MKRKLLFAFIFIILVDLFTFTIMTFYFFKKDYLEEKILTLNSCVPILQQELDKANSYDNIYQLSSELSKKTNLRISFYKDKDTIISDSHNNSIILNTPENRIPILDNKNNIYRQYSSELGEDYIYKVIPAVKFKNINLLLRVGTNLESIDLLSSVLKKNIISIFFLTIILTTFISVYITNKLMKPIELVTDGILEMSNGNFKKTLTINTQKELKELVNSYNKMAENLDFMMSQVEEMEEKTSEFFKNISHEIRTPITVISGFLEMLQDKNLDDSQKIKAISLMKIEMSRLEYLINDLLTLSGIKGIYNKDNKKTMDIYEELNKVLQILKPYSTYRNVNIKTIISNSTNKIIALEEDIFQVFINIINNAIKYSYSGGEIIIKLYAEDIYSVLEVEDFGIGIAKSELDNIFNEFYRTKDAKKHTKEGSGLGLNIVKNILTRNSGKIEISSTYGKGTVVKIYLNTEYT